MAGCGGGEERTALIAFGSETGSAEDVAHELGRITRRHHFNTTVTDLNSISLNELLRHRVVLISISTTGQGDLPANAQSLWRRLRSPKLQQRCLDRCVFTSFGLGDSSYPNFNWAHRKLHNRLRQLGAWCFHDRGEADEQHPEGIDGLFAPWAAGLKEKLLGYFPLPEGFSYIPDDDFLEPEWALERSEMLYKGSTGNTSSTKMSSHHVLPHHHDLIFVPGSQTAKLMQNTRVTPTTHWQDVRLIEFHLPHVQYGPGDVLTIFPKNFPQEVDQFIALMGWSTVADEPLQFTPRDMTSSVHPAGSPPIPLPASSYKTTLRVLLTNYLDINAVPRRSFFASIAHFAADSSHKERLIEFTKPDFLDEFYDYTSRSRRTIIEVLQEFDSVKIPFKWAASVLSKIKGRQFSIASGGHLKQGPDGLTKVQLLVAIVKYHTVIKKLREGLCTRYLANLKPGSELTVQLIKGGMKFFPERPAVMVGPGTGVAPLRSMIYERALLNVRAGMKSAPQVLFFGARNRAADYFFEEEWFRAEYERRMKVFPAFSRDQKSKVYVQDLIRRKSTTVFSLLQDGVVYVCGSSGKMPQAVREAIISVFEVEGKLPREEAEAHLVGLEKSGRYQQETW